MQGKENSTQAIEPSMQIELSALTMSRLLKNHQICVSEIRCLNRSTKQGLCQCLLTSCNCS